jgi:hypothetical protein
MVRVGYNIIGNLQKILTLSIVVSESLGVAVSAIRTSGHV